MGIFKMILCLWFHGTISYGISDKEFALAFKERLGLRHIVIHIPSLNSSLSSMIKNIKKERKTLSLRVQNANSSLKTIERELNIIDSNMFSKGYLNPWLYSCTIKEIKCGYFLIDVSDVDEVKMRQMLNSLSMDLNSQIYIYGRYDSGIKIFEVYKLRNNTNAVVLDFGLWNSETKELHANPEGIWKRRRNLHQLHFDVATEVSSPYMKTMVYNKTTKTYSMEGMFADIFLELKNIMNFTFTLMPSKDGEWGAKLSNGSWSGMIGMLNTKEIDIAIADFTVTFKRSEAINFSMPIVQIYYSLFIKNPNEALHFRAYIEPLSLMVWLVIGAAILVTFPLLYLVIWNGYFIDVNRESFSLSNCLAYCSSVLTFSRPWSIVPSTLRGKIIYGSLLLCGTMVFFHWEAMLISYLATRFTILPFHSLSELVHNTNYKISLSPGTSNMDAFKFFDDPLWQEAWKTRIEPYLDDYPKETSEQDKYIIDHPDTALYKNFFSARTYESFARCQIVAIPEKMDKKPYAFGFQRNSPYLNIFNHYLNKLRENGSLKRIIDKHDVGPQICPDYSGQALGFNSCFTGFLIIITGIIVALAIFVGECVCRANKTFRYEEGQDNAMQK